MAGIHEVLDRLCVLILGGVDCEGVEGIAESRLADELERGAHQDGSHLNLISDIYHQEKLPWKNSAIFAQNIFGPPQILIICDI
jgi:hypothetical protein